MYRGSSARCFTNTLFALLVAIVAGGCYYANVQFATPKCLARTWHQGIQAGPLLETGKFSHHQAMFFDNAFKAFYSIAEYI
jgi:hypothetical protein